MKIIVNGAPVELHGTTLLDLLVQLDKGDAKVATAVNEGFVASSLRATYELSEGDRVEIVAPRQGG